MLSTMEHSSDAAACSVVHTQAQTSRESANSLGNSIVDVLLQVGFQVAFLGKPLGTEVAAEWSFPCVCSLVCYQVGLVVGAVRTERALVPALSVDVGSTPASLLVCGALYQRHSSGKQGVRCNSSMRWS